MIPTSYGGTDVYLVTERPEWSERITGTFTLIGNAESSPSNREARQAYDDLIRVSGLKYTARVRDAGARALIGTLRTLKEQPVAMPFWPGERYWSDRATAPWGGGLMIVWKDDWSRWEIYSATDPEPADVGWPAAGDRWAPVLWGFLKNEQPSRWRGPSLQDWAVEFAEASPAAWALQPVGGSWSAGPLPPAGYSTAPDLFPVRPEFAEVLHTLAVRVSRAQTGFRRELNTTFYPQAVAQIVEQGFMLTSMAAIARLVAFYGAHGAASSFWVSAAFACAKLTANIVDGDTVLQVADTGMVSPGDYIALLDAAGTITGRRVIDTTATTITVDSTPGDRAAAATYLAPLLLCRWDATELEIEWKHGGFATAKTQLREIPAEYAPADDETLGVTLGELAPRALLYQFTQTLGGTVTTWRYTSYREDVDDGTHTWASADFSHGDLRRSLNLERDEVELESRIFTGNPLLPFITLNAEASLAVQIIEADVDGADVDNLAPVFTGELTRISRVGSKLTPTLTPQGRRMDQLVPAVVRGVQCPWMVYSAGCGLDRDDWEFTAEVDSPVSSAWPFALKLTSLARTVGSVPTYFANWFAGGWIEWGTGAALQRRGILTSTDPVSGALTLTLSRWWTGANPVAGDPVKLWPGCDKLATTCMAYNKGANPLGKFDNYRPAVPTASGGFGGKPFMSMATQAANQDSAGSAGKKG